MQPDALWAARAGPYEHALCLAQGDQKVGQRAAKMFDGLGAEAVARRVCATITRVGAQPAAKPRTSTRDNPSGLATRQMDLLHGVQDGSSNAGIADGLFISPKSVDHHVAAILAKLGVRTRAEAFKRALGWDLKA